MFSIIKKYKRNLNNICKIREKGVSLISLIVTIIVLLILASIAIKISSGDAGVIKKAKKGASIYENTSEDESETMDDYARKIKKFVKAPRAENIEFKADITEWTTNDVTVTATSDDPDCEIELKSEDSDWAVRKDNKITVSRNQQINARLKNIMDKYSEDVATYNVTNIDRLAPTNTAPTATATTNCITVTNKQTDSGSGIVSIQYQIKKKGNSTWEPLQSSAIFSGLIQNTEYDVRTHAIDKVGNSSDSVVTTIRTKSLAEVGVATASPTSLTSGDVIVTLPTEKNLTTLYTTDGNVPTLSSIKYTEPFIVSSNCTITFIYTDGNNVNSAGTIKISNIDKTIYKITYDLNGGTATNPDTYKVDTDTITLSNPTKEKYIFTGWTGSNGNTPQTEVKINKGSSGNKNFTANWTPKSYKLTVSDTSNYCTFDVYIDEQLVKSGVTGCNVDVKYNQKYEIKNINCLSGIVCNSIDLSGTMSDDVAKTLLFSRVPVNLDYYSFNTSIKGWLNDTEYSASGERTSLIDNNVKNIIFYANVVAPSGTILKMGDVDVYGTLSNGELKLQTRGSHYVMPEDYSRMFRSFHALTSINYNNCVDLSKIRVAEKTFENCKSLGDVNISSLFGENVTNLSECFISSGVKSVTFGKLNNAVNLFKTFADCKNLSNFTVVDGAVIKPTIMEGTFISCTALRSFTFAASKWDFSQVNTFTSLFQDASNLTSVNIEVQQKGISNKDISYNSMFNRCTNITSITLNFGSAPNAGANCRAMFQGCYKLQTLNMGNSNIGTIYNGSFMFNDCYSIQYINLLGHAKQISGYPNATDLDGASVNSMFADCTSLRRIFFNQPTDIVVAYYATGESMFVNDSKLEGFINGSNTTFNASYHTSANLSSIYAKNTDSPRSGVAGTGGFFWTSGAHN